MLKKLFVIENPHFNPVKWLINLENPVEITSPCEKFDKPREIDLMEELGVYYKANVPYERERLVYLAEDHPDEEGYIGFTKLLSDRCYEEFKKGNALYVNGGYCTYSPAVIGGLQRAIGDDKKIGIVWIDEHADSNFKEEAADGLLAAVPVCVITGGTMPEWAESCGISVPVNKLLLSDCRESSKKEIEYLKGKGAEVLSEAEFDDPQAWDAAVKRLADSVDVLFVQVDADIHKLEYIPCYDYPIVGGHDIDVVNRNVKTVLDTGKVAAFSTTCFYFDIELPGREINNLTALKIAASALSNWSETPIEGLLK